MSANRRVSQFDVTMKTITCESFAVCPPIKGDPDMTFALGLFSPQFPIRDGAHLIQIAASSLVQLAGGKLIVTVGRGDHRREFQIQLATQRRPMLPALTQAEKDIVLMGVTKGTEGTNGTGGVR